MTPIIFYVLAGYQSDTASSNIGNGSEESKAKKGSLRDYVNRFSPETVQEMARVVSQEAAHLIDMQTAALFGDYRELQEQMKVGRKKMSSHLNCICCSLIHVCCLVFRLAILAPWAQLLREKNLEKCVRCVKALFIGQYQHPVLLIDPCAAESRWQRVFLPG